MPLELLPKAPVTEAQAEGQQEGRQQHEDQRGPVAEDKFEVFETNEEYFTHGSLQRRDQREELRKVTYIFSMNSNLSMLCRSGAGRPLPGWVRGYPPSGS